MSGAKPAATGAPGFGALGASAPAPAQPAPMGGFLNPAAGGGLA